MAVASQSVRSPARSTARTQERIRPKFAAPRGAQWLHRPRLHTWLDTASQQGAVWLCAEPGAGKSTLAAAWASAWAQAQGVAMHWFRVDSLDLDLANCYAELLALVPAPLRSRVGAPPWPAYGSGGPVTPAAHALHARAFFRRLYAELGPCALVFDDAHAAASEGFATLLLAAVEEAPADTPLLITSRHNPAGVLLDAQARGALLLFSPGELAFTADEAVALLAPRVGADVAAELHRRTAGWAAGLVMLASGANTAPNTAPSAAAAVAWPNDAHSTVTEYFAQRVLALLDPSDLALLAAASWLPDTDPSALQALGQTGDAPQRMDRLAHSLGFVQRLQGSAPCWRLHDLLTAALQQRFDTLGTPAWQKRTLELAAQVHVQHGRLDAAVRLLVRAGSTADALATLRLHAPSSLRHNRAQQVVEAAAALPADQVATCAQLQALLGQACWALHDAAAGPHFENAWQLLAQVSPANPTPDTLTQQLDVAACALNAQFSGWTHFQNQEQWVQRLVDLYPAWVAAEPVAEVAAELAAKFAVEAANARVPSTDQLAQTNRSLRIHKAATLTYLTHRIAVLPDAAAAALQQRVLRLLAAPAGSLDMHVALGAAQAMAEFCNYSGDHALLVRLVDTARPLLAHADAPAAACAHWWVTLGWVTARLPLSQAGQPEGEAAVDVGVQLALQAGANDLAFSGLLNLMSAALSRNDVDRASALLQNMHGVADHSQSVQQASLHMLTARLLTQQGDAAAALLRVQRALVICQETGFPTSEAWPMHQGHVQVLTALHREDEAVACAQAAAALYQGLRADFLQVLAQLAQLQQAWRQPARVVVSDATHLLGQLPATQLALLRSTLALAVQHGWQALGNHLPALVAQVCAQALAHGVEPAFVTRIIRQRRLQAPQPHLPHWPWPLRVLALGGFAVQAGDQPLPFGARPQRKPIDLLKLLVAQGPAPVDVAWLTDTLWPDADGAQAKASFDMALLRLRKLLAVDGAVPLENGQLGLNRAVVWVDAWAWAATAHESGGLLHAGAPAGAATYAGPLFGTEPADAAWVATRERLHLQFVRRSVQQGQALLAASKPAAALQVFEAALVHDDLAEELHRGALQCLLAQGETAAALQAYARCSDALQRGLRVAPAAATAALVAHLR
jgi:LuxR family transcriptional regulator, maltose regulon positive regulatory protein